MLEHYRRSDADSIQMEPVNDSQDAIGQVYSFRSRAGNRMSPSPLEESRLRVLTHLSSVFSLSIKGPDISEHSMIQYRHPKPAPAGLSRKERTRLTAIKQLHIQRLPLDIILEVNGNVDNSCLPTHTHSHVPHGSDPLDLLVVVS